jgi:hypothetical protein
MEMKELPKLPHRLGKEKPVVSRELDMLSTPDNDNEAQYVLMLMQDKSETEDGRIFHQLIWGLYVCYRYQGKDVLDAWIEALTNTCFPTKKELAPPPSFN